MKQMYGAAQADAGPERSGVHALLRSSPHVVDLVIALPRPASAVAEGAADDTDDDPEVGGGIKAAKAEERADAPRQPRRRKCRPIARYVRCWQESDLRPILHPRDREPVRRLSHASGGLAATVRDGCRRMQMP